MSETPDEHKDYRRAIKDISFDDRPREKAIKQGISSLSRAELLAIIIGSGTPGESVIDLSQHILQWCDNKVSILGRKTIGDLKRNFKGVGDAKAISILAAIELGRQYALEVDSNESRQICSSDEAYKLMKYEIGHLNHEEFWIVALNNAKRVIGKYRISQGGTDATVVDVKIVLKTLIDNYASAMILYHNHPSGNIKPSMRDDAITKKMSQAAQLIDSVVIDHIIIGTNSYYSYADEGKL